MMIATNTIVEKAFLILVKINMAIDFRDRNW